MPRLVIGTAGHVDHGKTALVKALTGIDTDRLPAEKARGITLELGFARLPLSEEPAGDGLALIDVPGHERFVAAMAAGAGGIDLALLVVALDEGVRPQTREHVDICTLLGVRGGVVALTKADLNPSKAQADAVASEVRELLRHTPLAQAPQIRVSARSGEGLAVLRGLIAQAASRLRPRPSDGALYLGLDRAFTLKGFGTIATGTLLSGTLQQGEEVVLLPGALGPRRVRSLQVHGREVSSAAAGERVAVNLAGVEVSELSRGMVLGRPGELVESDRLDVSVHHVAAAPSPLRAREAALCHLGTTSAAGALTLLSSNQLAPGADGVGQLRLQRKLPVLPGQRFLLRGFQALTDHGRTLAGGQVLQVSPRKRKRAAAHPLAELGFAEPQRRVSALLAEGPERGLSWAELFARAGLGHAVLQEALERLSLTDQVRVCGDRWLHPRAFAQLTERAEAELTAHAAAEPESAGLPREALRRRLDPHAPEGLAEATLSAILAELARRGQLQRSGERLAGVGHRGPPLERPPLERALLEELRRSALSPPGLETLAATVHAERAAVAQALARLTSAGEVVRVADGLHFAQVSLEALKAKLLEHLRLHGAISVAQFKALTGGSRKFAIPLCEYFDQTKVTLRRGEERILRGSPR